MRVITPVVEMQQEAEAQRRGGKKIGLVPTMGYLHDAHLKLVEEAKRNSDFVILSLFVNPTQFGPEEDFDRYPRDFERDRRLAEEAGVDVLFNPGPSTMYGSDFGTYVEEQEAARILEGKFRPKHFRGVTTVVAKLFNICKPHIAVFGQKDAQQVFIVKKMVQDLNFDVSIVVLPIVRDADGVAMSSRNVYLSKEERSRAPVLHESLEFAEEKLRGGATEIGKLRMEMEEMIKIRGGAQIDYVAFLDPEKFRETDRIVRPAILVALAARFGKTRLIDNSTINIE